MEGEAKAWLKRVNKALEERKAWEDRARRTIKLYRHADQKDKVPLAHRIAKLMLAYVYFRDPEPVVVSEKEELNIVARAMERVLSRMRRLLNLRPTNRRVVLDALLTDLGVCKVTATLRGGKPAIDVMRVSPFDFVADSAGLGVLDDCAWCAQRIYMSADAVRKNKLYKNTSKVEGAYRLVSEGKDNKVEWAKGGGDDVFGRFVKLWEIYHREADGLWVTVVADEYEPLILRHERFESPVADFPFVTVSFNPVVDSPYGIPVLWILRGLHEDINKAMRQVIEKSGKQISAVAIREHLSNWADIEDAIENNNSIGMVIKVRGSDIDSIVRPIEAGGVKQSDVVLLQVLMDMMHRVSGITQAQLSGVVMGRKTATEAEMIQQASTITLSDLADEVEEYMNRQYEMLAKWAWQARLWDEEPFIPSWLPEEELDAFLSAPPDAIDALRISVERGSGAVLWHRQKAQEMQLLLQVLSNPIVQQKMAEEGYKVNLAPVLERWLSHMGIRDIAVVLQRRGIDEQDIGGGEGAVAKTTPEELRGNLPVGWEAMAEGVGQGGGLPGAPILPEGGGGEGLL
ncbi:MAG: hypothetical protein DRP82_01265 [Planctomycetota bacterium]|nr:MAG: hypothetical protein DRP82_01265 [Planctomycetota bacterium]